MGGEGIFFPGRDIPNKKEEKDMKLYCGKCGRETSAEETYVCYHCGNFLCRDCAKHNLCPDCFDGVSYLM